VLIKAERGLFQLHGDIMEIADKASHDFIPHYKEGDKVRLVLAAAEALFNW
jgi:hypothetical protein